MKLQYSLRSSILCCFVLFSFTIIGKKLKLNPSDFLTPERFGIIKITTDTFATVTNYKSNSQILQCDIYQPLNDSVEKRPCILWIHGGGFRSDTKRTQNYIVKYATELSKRGFVCISIDYRLRDAVDMPTKAAELPALKDAARDANTALDWIRKNAKKYKINPNLLFIAGGSAGGRTAITVSQFVGPDEEAITIPEINYKHKKWNKKGIIACAALWGSLEPEFRSWTYPNLNSKSIPCVLIHGELDKTIPIENSIELSEAMLKVDVGNELHILPGAAHTPTGPKTDAQIEEWLTTFFVTEWMKAKK